MKDVTILICSHKAPDSLYETLKSIINQSNLDSIEIILVNNGFLQEKENTIYNFMKPYENHVSFQIVRECRPGLGFARRRGFELAEGRFILLLDDDNFLGPEFLSYLIEVIERIPDLGGICPIVQPIWEYRPADWLVDFGRFCLSYNAVDHNRPKFHECYWPPKEAHTAMRPPGGGMIIHRQVAQLYLRTVTNPKRIALSRQPDSLVGCEDEDIFSGVIALKLSVFYTDRLEVYHYIPRDRTQFSYLMRLNYQMLYSYGVLDRLNNPFYGSYLFSDTRQVAKRVLDLGKAFLRGSKSPKLCLLEIVRDLGLMMGHFCRI